MKLLDATKFYLKDISLFFLRVLISLFMIIGHGWPKFLKFFGDEPISFSDPLGIGQIPSLILATGAEFFCSILVILGLFTRFALVPLAITMLVAFLTNLDGSFTQMEKALMYLIIYLFLFAAGPGRFSLDAALFKRS